MRYLRTIEQRAWQRMSEYWSPSFRRQIKVPTARERAIQDFERLTSDRRSTNESSMQISGSRGR